MANVLVRFTPERAKRTSPWRMFTSMARYLSYRGYRYSALRYWSPALGVMILGVVGAAFFFGRGIFLLYYSLGELIIDL